MPDRSVRSFRDAPQLAGWSGRVTLLVLACVLLWAANTAGAWVLAHVLPTPTAPAGLLLPEAERFLAPEPVERMLFLANLLLGPPLLLGLVVAATSGPQKRQPCSTGRLEGVLCAGLSILLILPLPTALAMRASIGAAGMSPNGSLLHTALAFAMAALTVLITLQAHRAGWHWPLRLRGKLRLAAVGAGLICSGLGLISFRLFGFQRLTGSAVWSDHLDAAISAIARVKAGGTLLVDAPSQYGLYPELLAPVLHGLPDGLRGVTLAFAIVQLLSLLAVLSMLRHRLHNPWLAWVAALALAMLTFGLHSVSGFRFSEFDPYFQYWPVRFAGPALSIPLVFWLFRKLCWPRIGLISAWTALCLFWNLDSGAAVLYAVSMLLALLSGIAGISGRRFGRWNWRSLTVATLVFPIGSVALLTGAVGALSLKAQAPLHLAWVTGFQATFYGLGFMMLPLPPWPDAWFGVAAGYVIALLLGLIQLQQGQALGRVLPLLYLSLLGSGLFTYYQGRSHFFNLVSVSWPLIPLLAILMDRHLLALRRGLAPAMSAGLPIAGLTVLLMPSLALMQSLPNLVQAAGQPLINTPDPTQPAAPYVSSELAMVRRFCSDRAQPCLLLCKRQAIYALETNTASAWTGPSPAEMLLQTDQIALIQSIRNGTPERILFGIGPFSRLNQLPVTPADLMRHYRVSAVNPDNTMVLLVRKPSGAQQAP